MRPVEVVRPPGHRLTPPCHCATYPKSWALDGSARHLVTTCCDERSDRIRHLSLIATDSSWAAMSEATACGTFRSSLSAQRSWQW
jgi:hypothetical protein